jgi:hypothetical protein
MLVRAATIIQLTITSDGAIARAFTHADLVRRSYYRLAADLLLGTISELIHCVVNHIRQPTNISDTLSIK